MWLSRSNFDLFNLILQVQFLHFHFRSLIYFISDSYSTIFTDSSFLSLAFHFCSWFTLSNCSSFSSVLRFYYYAPVLLFNTLFVPHNRKKTQSIHHSHKYLKYINVIEHLWYNDVLWEKLASLVNSLIFLNFSFSYTSFINNSLPCYNSRSSISDAILSISILFISILEFPLFDIRLTRLLTPMFGPLCFYFPMPTKVSSILFIVLYLVWKYSTNTNFIKQ